MKRTNFSINEPYVKQSDEYGNLLNPIKEAYLHNNPNRRERRLPLQKTRFCGNSKNYHLTVLRTGKYKRVVQSEKDKKTGEIKRIEHYLQS